MKSIIGLHPIAKLNEFLKSKFNDTINIAIADTSTTRTAVVGYIKTHTDREVFIGLRGYALQQTPKDSLIILSKNTNYTNQGYLTVEEILKIYGKKFKIIIISYANKRKKNTKQNTHLKTMSMYLLPKYELFKTIDIILFINNLDDRSKIKIIKHLNERQCKIKIENVCYPECEECNNLQKSMDRLAESLAYALTYTFDEGKADRNDPNIY